MRKDFLKIMALVLLTTFVFQNCDDKSNATADLTPNNLNDVIKLGLYGKVKSMTSTSYRATWNATTKKPVPSSDFSGRTNRTFNEQGFQTSNKYESYRTTFTVASDKQSATAKKEPYVADEVTSTFDSQNRIISKIEKNLYSDEPRIKINDSGTEKTVSYYDDYFTREFNPDNYSIQKITAKEGITILGIVHSEGYVTHTKIVYDDATKTATMTEVEKRGTVTTDSIVYICKLLPNGKIDEFNMEGISYNTSVAANKPETKIQTVAEKDDKGNPTLRYYIETPYKEDETLDETRTSVGSYAKIEYTYW